MLPYTQQLNAAQTAYPEAAIAKFTPNVAANRSTEVELTTSDERTLTVFVNPYTGRVLGDRDEVHNLQSTVRKLHSELKIGKFGDYEQLPMPQSSASEHQHHLGQHEATTPVVSEGIPPGNRFSFSQRSDSGSHNAH